MAIAVKVTFEKLQFRTPPEDLFVKLNEAGKKALSGKGYRGIIPSLHLAIAANAGDADGALARVAGREVFLPKGKDVIVDDEVLPLIENKFPGLVERGDTSVLTESDAIVTLKSDLAKADARVAALEASLAEADSRVTTADSLRLDAEARARGHSDRVLELEQQLAVAQGQVAKLTERVEELTRKKPKGEKD